MKKTLLVTALMTSTVLTQAHIDNFDTLRKHVIQGHSISAHFNMKHCTESKSALALSYKDMQTVVRFNDISLYQPVDESEPMIAASVNHFTMHHSFGPTNMFLRVRVGSNNQAKLDAYLIDPVQYTVHQHATFTCPLGEGMTFRKIN